MLDADLADHAPADEHRLQRAERPPCCRRADLLRGHVRIANNGGTNFGGKDERMRRTANRLQPEHAVPLKTLSPAADAAAPDPHRCGDLGLAEATASRQHDACP